VVELAGHITLVLEQTSTVLQVPMGYIYLALPLSSLTIAIYTLCDWFDLGVLGSAKTESK
jgi:TRAP-type C4-dicarboxylate transport system permease small subunit